MEKKNPKSSWFVTAALAFGVGVGVTLIAEGGVVFAAVSPGRQWLLKMDTDKDGTVSKDEMMKYMGAEFEKADVDHDGTLDAKELGQLRANLAGGR